jgi:TonB family protein
MKICGAMVVSLMLLASGYTQGSPDYYIASLQMPCYPPLACQARVQGQAKVMIEVANDGAVTSAEALEGNPILRSAALPNARTWKFGGGPGADLSRLKTTIVFDYRLEGEPGWERCAARVIFDSFNKVEIIGHPPVTMTNDAPAKRP